MCVLTGERTRCRAHILHYFSHPVQIFLFSLSLSSSLTQIQKSAINTGAVLTDAGMDILIGKKCRSLNSNIFPPSSLLIWVQVLPPLAVLSGLHIVILESVESSKSSTSLSTRGQCVLLKSTQIKVSWTFKLLVFQKMERTT